MIAGSRVEADPWRSLYQVTRNSAGTRHRSYRSCGCCIEDTTSAYSPSVFRPPLLVGVLWSTWNSSTSRRRPQYTHLPRWALCIASRSRLLVVRGSSSRQNNIAASRGLEVKAHCCDGCTPNMTIGVINPSRSFWRSQARPDARTRTRHLLILDQSTILLFLGGLYQTITVPILLQAVAI